MGLNTSADAPLPVGEVSRLIGGWIDRLGAIWVEGQITQLSRRPGAGVVFLTLRDPAGVGVPLAKRFAVRIRGDVAESRRRYGGLCHLYLWLYRLAKGCPLPTSSIDQSF